MDRRFTGEPQLLQTGLKITSDTGNGFKLLYRNRPAMTVWR
jgi:hypothetical protein